MINPTMDKTYSLVSDVIANIEAEFIDEVIHLGGDEVVYECWKQNSSILAWMDSNNISTYDDLSLYYRKR